eukprot:355782-Prymnesium_polylepis.1
MGWSHGVVTRSQERLLLVLCHVRGKSRGVVTRGRMLPWGHMILLVLASREGGEGEDGGEWRSGECGRGGVSVGG